jgi:hypothetical protein
MRIRLFLAALFLMGGCGIKFSVEGEIGEQRIEPGLLGGVLNEFFPPIPLTIDIDAALAAQNVKQVKGIFLDEIVLDITPAGEGDGADNFDFVTSIEIFATSEDEDLPRVKIAEVQHEADGAKTLVIPGVEGVDLKDYVQAGINVEASATGSVPPSDLTFDGAVTVIVQAL